MGGEPHTHELSGAILHVGSRSPGVVEFWAYYSGGPMVNRTFMVFGTAHRLPAWATPLQHRGSALISGFVWHLFEMPL